MAAHFTSLDQLAGIDWPILQRRDFKRDDNDIAKTDRYQAEALVWKHLPVEGILGICCYTETVRDQPQARVGDQGLSLKVFNRTEWYFR